MILVSGLLRFITRAHASGPTPVVLISEATLASLDLEVGSPVEVATATGSAVLEAGVADLPDDVVWVAGNLGGLNLARDLGAASGSRVTVRPVQAAVPAKGVQG